MQGCNIFCLSEKARVFKEADDERLQGGSVDRVGMLKDANLVRTPCCHVFVDPRRGFEEGPLRGPGKAFPKHIHNPHHLRRRCGVCIRVRQHCRAWIVGQACVGVLKVIGLTGVESSGQYCCVIWVCVILLLSRATSSKKDFDSTDTETTADTDTTRTPAPT